MKLITFPQSTVIEKKKHLKHPFSRPNDQMQKRFFFGCFLFVCYTKNKQTNKKQSKGAEEEASRCHPFQMLYKPPFFITGKKNAHSSFFFFFPHLYSWITLTVKQIIRDCLLKRTTVCWEGWARLQLAVLTRITTTAKKKKKREKP